LYTGFRNDYGAWRRGRGLLKTNSNSVDRAGANRVTDGETPDRNRFA